MTKVHTVFPRKIQFFIKTFQGKDILLYLHPNMKVSTLQEILNHLDEYGGPPGWTLIKYKSRTIYSEQNILELIQANNDENSLEISMQLVALLSPIKPRVDNWLINFGFEAQNKVQTGRYLVPSSDNYVYQLFNFSKKSKNYQYTRKSRRRAFRLMILLVCIELVIFPQEVWLKHILPFCISPGIDENGQFTKHSTRYG
jgi:hypothetical protein